MIVERIPAIQALSTAEKYTLMGELWEEVEGRQDQLPFDEAVVELLDQRFAAYRANPQSAMSWDDFRKQLGKS